MKKKSNVQDHALINEYIQDLYLKKAFEIDLPNIQSKKDKITELFIEQLIKKVDEDLQRIKRKFTSRGIQLTELKPGYYRCLIQGIVEEIHFDPEWMGQQVNDVAERLLNKMMKEAND